MRNPGKGDVSYMFTDSFIGSVAHEGNRIMGKEAHTHIETHSSWLLSQTVPSGEVQGSVLILLTGTSWCPVNTPTTYSSGKLNC